MFKQRERHSCTVMYIINMGTEALHATYKGRLWESKMQAEFQKESTVLERQSAPKLVETLCPKGAFWCFTDFQRENKVFPPPSPPCNVVSLVLLRLPIENNKHPNLEWRGEGCGFFCPLCIYPIWVQCLNNFVADCRSQRFCPTPQPPIKATSPSHVLFTLTFDWSKGNVSKGLPL